tara:strand:+ start:9982 stop:10458 length:477 start_codon:yes stop_codon:yes gene_type:complete
MIPKPKKNRRSKRQIARKGATLVEAAITLPLMLWILLSMLDLGLAAVRFNALAEAARRVCRQAIIHGQDAGEITSAWGPEAYEATAATASPMVAPAATAIPTMAPDEVSIRIAWPDGDNAPRDRVETQLQYTHEPLLSGLMPWGPFQLDASCTMSIVN